MEKITLRIGDFGGDGHGRVKEIEVISNVSATEMQQAYILGSKKLGFHIKNLCSDYEESEIEKKDYYLICELGFHSFAKKTDKSFEDDSWERKNRIRINYNFFALMYLFACWLGNPKCEFKIEKKNYANIIDIGGYGFFS
jgi:hypothetical protein